ncbi:hypothetical protein [Cupriavidus basilensis]|uniref:hypothetical protein n=1 Tax=Cupriavidus basilensis TaxID=68895 RepID=UPI0020A6D2AD|nr:hypothetical protein [Cupriavidus basilensis]MCP3017411.1 hypothetical protein [Cupriavidus basilensis]
MQTYRVVLLDRLNDDPTEQDLRAVSPRAAAEAALAAANGRGSFTDALVIENHDGALGEEYWYRVWLDGSLI